MALTMVRTLDGDCDSFEVKVGLYQGLVLSPLLCIIHCMEPLYNTHFWVYSDISVITEQPYNKGLIHRKYKQWKSCRQGVISK